MENNSITLFDLETTVVESKVLLLTAFQKRYFDGYFAESYHKNGKLNYKGSYLNNVRVGPWISYWDDGNLAYKGLYKNGSEIGYWQFSEFRDKQNKHIFYVL